MALLKYDIEVVGSKAVHQALSGIERRLAQHNQFVARTTGGASTSRSPVRLVRDHNALAEREAKRSRDKIAAQVEREKQAVFRRDRGRADRAMRDEERGRRRIHAESLRAAEKESRARAEFTRRTLGNSAAKVGGALKTVGVAGAAMLGIGGAGLAASSVAQAAKLDEATRRVIIQGGAAGSKYDPDKLRGQFTRTGIETGIAPEDIAAGVGQYVTKVGDIDTAIANMKTFATVAQATGASMTDIASAAADMSEKMDIKSVDDMQQALAILTAQGKKGAFELRDMAGQFPRISAAAQVFGVKGVGGLAQLGGFLQVARSATGSGESAGFATEASLRQLTAKSAAMQSGEAFGGRKVQIFREGNPELGTRNFNDILGDVMEASRGNKVQLQEVFGEEGIRAIRPLIAAFSGEYERGGRGAAGAKAGRAAVMAKLADASDVKTSWADIQKDSADAMRSFSVQMEIFNTQMKDAVASQLFPELVKLAPELKKLIPVAADVTSALIGLVKFFTNHPFLGIGSVIAAQVAADVASAKIGEIISKSISGGGKGISVAGAALSILGAATITATAGVSLIDAAASDAANRNKDIIARDIEGGNTASQLAGGDASKLGEAKERLASIRNLIAGGEKRDPTSGWWAKSDRFVEDAASGALNWATAGGAGRSWGESRNAEEASGKLSDLKATAAALEKAIAAAESAAKSAAAAAASSAGASGPNRSNTPSPVVNKHGT